MDDIITLYRVEDARGRGPYHWTFDGPVSRVANEMANRHTDWDWRLADLPYEDRLHLHPGPYDDPGLHRSWMTFAESKYTRFGFATIEQLGLWFFGEGETLRAMGMHVAVVAADADLVFHGEYQSIFDRRFADCIETRALEDVL